MVRTIPTSPLSLRRFTSGWRRMSVIVPSCRRYGCRISRHTHDAYSFRHIRDHWALPRHHRLRKLVGATSSRRRRSVSIRGTRVTLTTRHSPRTDRSARSRKLILRFITLRTSSIFDFRSNRSRGLGLKTYFPSRKWTRVTRRRYKVSATHMPGRPRCAPTRPKRRRRFPGRSTPSPWLLRRA